MPTELFSIVSLQAVRLGAVAETALIKDLAARARERMDGMGDNSMRILLVYQ